MSKRNRTGARGSRPGTRRPIHRPAGERATRPATSDDQPAAAAAPLEVAPDVTGAQVEQRLLRESAELRRPIASAHVRPRAKPGSVLAARAANEYVYVAQDMKRITLVAGSLFVAMLAAWLLIAVLKVVDLGLY